MYLEVHAREREWSHSMVTDSVCNLEREKEDTITVLIYGGRFKGRRRHFLECDASMKNILTTMSTRDSTLSDDDNDMLFLLSIYNIQWQAWIMVKEAWTAKGSTNYLYISSINNNKKRPESRNHISRGWCFSRSEDIYQDFYMVVKPKN